MKRVQALLELLPGLTRKLNRLVESFVSKSQDRDAGSRGSELER